MLKLFSKEVYPLQNHQYINTFILAILYNRTIPMIQTTVIYNYYDPSDYKTSMCLRNKLSKFYMK